MKLDSELEERLKAKAFKFLEKGTPGWDVLHTIASVYWMRRLIEKEGGNEKVLVTVMYLHDIGYYNLIREEYGFDEVWAVKKDHMIKGAKESEKILRELGYSEDEIKEIVHLVFIHDKLDQLSTYNEILVMEADSLAQIDVEKVKPTFDKENYLKFLEHFEKERVPRFKTKTGKEFLPKLLDKAKHYFN
ncbi:HD domain-containing protein [Candidatus Woesearchaeota archaeon]|nr:HD domain-containing protein [Candidatus Woesearchaeota archaeon]